MQFFFQYKKHILDERLASTDMSVHQPSSTQTKLYVSDPLNVCVFASWVTAGFDYSVLCTHTS